MIKILTSSGYVDQFEFKCINCDTKFIAGIEDVDEVIREHVFDDDASYFASMYCPVCKTYKVFGCVYHPESNT